MIKRYIVVTAFTVDNSYKPKPDGFDLLEEVYEGGILTQLNTVSHFHFKELAMLQKIRLECEAKKSKQWLEVLPPLMQFDSLTEEEMLKDYV